jgi:hypothetical protein
MKKIELGEKIEVGWNYYLKYEKFEFPQKLWLTYILWSISKGSRQVQIFISLKCWT